MFRKLVTNLPFSPSLVGQLGFYAKRLKQEEATRRMALLFTALALIVQSLAVFSPPESANAANSSDLIYGGVTSKAQLLQAYDSSARGNGDLKAIFDYAGITRDEIKNTKESSVNSIKYGKSDGAWLSWGRVHRFSASDGEVKHTIPTGNSSTTVYSRPLWRFDSTAYTKNNGSTYAAFVGTSAKMGSFAILKNCGNLVTRKVPHPSPAGKILATCDAITGVAYDGRNRSVDVKVYLYFGGKPGIGEKVGPILASGSGNSFSYSVPERYRLSEVPTPVYGVLVPLAGWSESTVPLSGSAKIPSKCVETPKPTATCVSLTKRLIDRTRFSLDASAAAANGASVSSYRFVVKDSSGKIVSEQTIKSSSLVAKSNVVELTTPGKYSSSVEVTTSNGIVTSPGCSLALDIAPEKTCAINPSLPEKDPECKPCPEDPSLWHKDPGCAVLYTQSKTAINLSQSNVDATTTKAQPADRIEYRVTVDNIGKVDAKIEVSDLLADILEYSTIQDNGGGTYNEETKTLSWGEIAIKPGEKQTRSFVIKVNDPIPSTPRGQSEPGSYDCILTNTFGNSISIPVNCPDVKAVEGAVSELPTTGPGENILFAGIVASITTYFYARSRQLSKEVRIIRHEFNSGTL